MKIAVIGAGFTGLAAAYRLSQRGNEVSVFERDPEPGGLAIGYQEKGWDWTLEAFYHHWFTNDKAILKLAEELDFPVVIRRPKTSHFIEGKIYQLDSAWTLMKFTELSLIERLQMGLVLGLLRFNPFWKPLERVSAAGFLSRTIGKRAYRILWEPLLIGKFGQYVDQISLAWFWARIVKRTTELAYPEGGFLRFAKRIEKGILKNGGRIYYRSAIELIKEEGGSVSLGKYGIFDKVIVTLPSFAFIKLAPQLREQYKKSLLSLSGLGAVALVVRFKKKFFEDGTYWLSVCDTEAPVLAVVEHTNFMDSSHYNNEHIVYLANYLPKEHKYFSLGEQELLGIFDPFLRTLNPDYKKSLIGVRKFTAPFAQPIIPVNYSHMVPEFKTPIKNVFLANMQQVYPWDRGTNYAVELGERVAGIAEEG